PCAGVQHDAHPGRPAQRGRAVVDRRQEPGVVGDERVVEVEQQRLHRPTSPRIHTPASRTAPRSTPVSWPRSCRNPTSASVERLPGAPGANGQPPRPPAEESKMRTPASSPAATFSSASPPVSWRWRAISSTGTDPATADTTAGTCSGRPTPIVSPIEICPQPRPRSAAATPATTSGRTSPEYGQPNAVEMYPRVHIP